MYKRSNRIFYVLISRDIKSLKLFELCFVNPGVIKLEYINIINI